uniref:VraH family peptide resistance protein n=1 Tax=Staphylococcus simulans TaxID=1286 RepID=UPI00155D91AE|nr:VraH family protein [Staphylococcus simulans]
MNFKYLYEKFSWMSLAWILVSCSVLSGILTPFLGIPIGIILGLYLDGLLKKDAS